MAKQDAVMLGAVLLAGAGVEDGICKDGVEQYRPTSKLGEHVAVAANNVANETLGILDLIYSMAEATVFVSEGLCKNETPKVAHVKAHISASKRAAPKPSREFSHEMKKSSSAPGGEKKEEAPLKGILRPSKHGSQLNRRRCSNSRIRSHFAKQTMETRKTIQQVPVNETCGSRKCRSPSMKRGASVVF